MKKVLKGLISLVFAVMVLVPMSAFAATDVATYDELKTAVSNGGEIKLGADVTVTEDLNLSKNATLDLNGKTITVNGATIYVLADVTIKDTSSATSGIIKNTAGTSSSLNLIVVGNSSTTGKLTVDSGNIETNGGNSAIYVTKGNTTLNGGTIKLNTGGKTAIDVKNDNIMTMNGGSIINKNGFGIRGFANTKIIVNGGSIEVVAFAIYGNGITGNGNNKFEINGGTFTALDATAQAIYLPQLDGDTLITGGTFNGASAVEIRAGKLNITGGTFNATTAGYRVVPSNGGSTTEGAGVAIDQHTTKAPLEVKISGGTFNATVPVSETNPQDNNAEALAKVKVSITGGTFNTINSGDKSVISSDFTKFITGGTYTKAPDKTLLADGYTAYKKENGDNYLYVVDKKSTIKVNKDFYQISKGESVELDYTIEGPGKDYATLYNFTAGMLSLEGDKVTGLMPGVTDIIIELNDLDDTYEYVSFYVYDLVKDDNVSEGSEVQAENAIKETTEKFFELWADDSIESDEDFENKFAESVKGISLETFEKVLDAMWDGETILTEVTVKDIAEEITDEDKKLITDTLKKDEAVIGYFDINFLLKTEDEELGNITELENPIKILLDIPSDLPELKDKYVRTYYVVRIHDGETTKIEAEVVDGKIVFETDKFSTYALAYTDTVKNPQTGDNIIAYMIALLVSLTGIAGGVLYLKKSKTVKNN